MKRILKNTGKTLILPGSVLVVMLTACAIKGVPFWAAQGGFRAFLYTMLILVFSAFALGMHLFAGRFDFSLGSVGVLSGIISGQIAVNFDMTSSQMLIVFLVTGAVLGAVSGLVYILTNLPPIITSLGVCLAYEGLSFTLSGGSGTQIALYPKLLGGAGVAPMLILLVSGLALMYILFNHTRFGYNYKAIQFGQKIAVDTGLNEKSNAFVCYILAGILVAVTGYLKISYNGSQPPQIGLSTSAAVFGAMLPMFMGGLIGKWCEQNLSMAVGCVTTSIIMQGLSSLGVSIQARNLITSFLMLAILMYSTNGKSINEWVDRNFAKRSRAVPARQ
ncbi:MAG: hypothetical protein LBK04_03860 [Clostridiales Family XIII bacterium]|jgi:ribose transport system permease protein|nr:hypothetical protein [Clostridiales Family XIII bacterium]